MREWRTMILLVLVMYPAIQWSAAEAQDGGTGTLLDEARARYAEGKYDGALAALGELDLSQVEAGAAADAVYLEGRCLEGKGELSAAMERYKRIVEKYAATGPCEEAAEALAVCYQKTRSFDGGMDYFLGVLKNEPGNAAAKLGRWRLIGRFRRSLLTVPQLRRVQEICEEVMEHESGSLEAGRAKLGLALVYSHLDGKRDQALRLYDEVIREFKGTPLGQEAETEFIRTCSSFAEERKAPYTEGLDEIELAERFLEMNPDASGRTQLRRGLAAWHAQAGNLDKAFSHLECVANECPKEIVCSALNAIGAKALGAGHSAAELRASMSTFSERHSESAAGKLAGEWSLALVEPFDPEATESVSNEVLFWAASGHLWAGNCDVSLKMMETILARSPSERDYLHVAEGRCGIFWVQGKDAEAAEVLIDAVDKYPEADCVPHFLIVAAQRYEAAGMNDAALDAYYRLINDRPDGRMVPKALFAAAGLWHRFGNIESAIGCLERLVSEYPDSANVQGVDVQEYLSYLRSIKSSE